ncbi:MAG: cytochrome P450 [Sandarakinorhabdus sp.]|nr:cytochrome P450 [Sandarakinorhabdus sp.]
MKSASLSPVAPKPAHVPDALVYDFDIHADPGLLADPHDRILKMIDEAPPVFWSPRNGGGWIVLGYDANYKASRDTETFSSEFVSREQMKAMLAKLPPGAPHIPQPIPILLDPPEHTKYRQPLQRVFSPGTIAGLKDSIRLLAAELIEAVKPAGGCEFMSAIAEPLPVQVFLKMLGLPLDRMPTYRAIVKEHMEAIDTDREGAMRRLMTISAAMRDVVLDRRDNPQDDILSMLWKIEIDGQPTTLADMENYGVLLFIAGLDTVMNGMGLAIRGLAGDPGLQRELRANPKRIGVASEEMLRRYTFTVPMRIVKRDVELEGAAMKPGDTVKLLLPAANLDARAFADPARYDLDRENNVHIAFGVGPHRCLGSHLARVEIQILYEEMLARLPEFRLDPDHPPVMHGGHVMGVESLHLLWDA